MRTRSITKDRMETTRDGLFFSWTGGPYIEVSAAGPMPQPFDVINTTDENGEPPPFHRRMFFDILDSVDMKALRHALRASQMDSDNWTQSINTLLGTLAALTNAKPYSDHSDAVLDEIIAQAKALRT
jgi:hypothetical protein